MNNNESNFKSLYKDGLIPTKEFHEIEKQVSKTLTEIFNCYINKGYSPREIAELVHSCTGLVCSEKAIFLTLRKKLEAKNSG
jgi:hypothetical protein